MRIHVCKACANLRSGLKTRIAIPHTCGKTDEEIALDLEKRERHAKRFKSMLTALAAIKAEPLDKGKIKCPECGGDLYYTKASSNGHVWGKCKTEGCLSWMQ